MAKSRTDKPDKLFEVSIIDFAQLKFGPCLGSGGFGEVFKGIWQRYDVAIKQIFLKTFSTDLDKEFRNEVAIMSRCRHPSLVHLYGIALQDNSKYLIMEYLPNKSLYEQLSTSDVQISWPMRTNYCYDIAAGLAYLHSVNVVHRDLKSLNILLDKENRAKISDFGLSVIKIATLSSITRPTKIGSIRWNAPELFQSVESMETFKSDIWSFGMVMYEIVSRKIPFAQVADDMRVVYFITSGAKLPIPNDCPSALSEIIQKCWTFNSSERPDANEILAQLSPHAWTPEKSEEKSTEKSKVEILEAELKSAKEEIQSLKEEVEKLQASRNEANLEIEHLKTQLTYESKYKNLAVIEVKFCLSW